MRALLQGVRWRFAAKILNIAPSPPISQVRAAAAAIKGAHAKSVESECARRIAEIQLRKSRIASELLKQRTLLADEKASLMRHLSAVSTAQAALVLELKTQKATLDKEVLAAAPLGDEAVSATLRAVMQGFDAAADTEVAIADARVRSLLELTLGLLRKVDGAAAEEDYDGEAGDVGLAAGENSAEEGAPEDGSACLDGDNDGAQDSAAPAKASTHRRSRRSVAASRWDGGAADMSDDGDDAKRGCAESLELVYEL